ncbi:hypothetical protein GA0074692_6816 [Micromonospora pallida]|uniref:Uncharacterized protein n=1 Tax=Micromonospora pallida TaxID=145854 RepID=A0A1C6TNK4_9ACTN|nr:hypothetical protein [Micromonospora pallida]SCL16403.1 hypothetical protein GA0074692_0021 [Micromonospora pallida]SCL43314.1 hypothetical protein GA0074692_6816 [Micromonospora pallida]
MERAERFLAALRETLELTDRLNKRSLERQFWVPRPSSVFDRELQNTQVDKRGIPWGQDEATYAFEMAYMSMFAVGDHLAAIHTLLQPPIPVLGQAVLARSVFESAAFAFWIMDPHITVRQRVARAYLVFWSEAKRNLKVTPKHETANVAAAQMHLDKVLGRIDELGLSRAGVTVEGEQIPSKTVLVAELFADDLLQPHKNIYSPYSGVTHGEMTALMTRKLTPTGADPVWSITPRQLTENVELAMAAFRALHRRLCFGGMGAQGMGGQPGLEHRLWENNVGRRLEAIHRALV